MNARPVHEDEVAAVGRLISYSFDQLAANAFLTSDPARRLDVNGEHVTLITEHTRLHGWVDVIDDADESELTADAVWFDCTRDMPQSAARDLARSSDDAFAVIGAPALIALARREAHQPIFAIPRESWHAAAWVGRPARRRGRAALGGPATSLAMVM